jgi:hypothetical protein
LLFALPLSPVQHEQQPSFLPSAGPWVIEGSAASPVAAFFFIGHDASPLQQPSLSQHEADSPPAAILPFIGHESPLQQQHPIAVLVVNVARWYATAAMAMPSTSSTEMTSRILFLILVTSLLFTESVEAGTISPGAENTC